MLLAVYVIIFVDTSSQITIIMKSKNCSILEILLFGRFWTTLPYPYHWMEVSMHTFRKLRIQMTIHRFLSHKANLSILMDWHNTVSLFVYSIIYFCHDLLWIRLSLQVYILRYAWIHLHTSNLDAKYLFHEECITLWVYAKLPTIFKTQELVLT